jgi:hypothetical protein
VSEYLRVCFTEIELENPPTDSVTRVRWSPVDPNLLLVGSWDSVRHLPHPGVLFDTHVQF